ncbi:MAG: hypothetical protein IKF83_02865 [Clostridia bacterium]|nr:hypothetical protein [Clostridia bacterium]
MKNKNLKVFLSVIITVLLTLIITNSTVKANNEPTYLPKDITAYSFGLENSNTFTCLFRDDLPEVPFVNVENFLEELYTLNYTTTKQSNDIYIVSCENGEMEIDVENDKIHFDAFESFVYNNIKYQLEPSSFVKEHKLEYDGLNNSVNLDLKKYNMDIVEYNGNVYMPLPVINDITMTTYSSGIYLDDKIYIVGYNDDYYFDITPIYENMTRSQALADFSYDELCFAIDYFYGRPSHAQISDGIKEKGLDLAINEYSFNPELVKRLLKSTDNVDYFYGLAGLDPIFEDGGHTSFTAKLYMEIDEKFKDSPLFQNIQAVKTDVTDERYQIIEQPNSLFKMMSDFSDLSYYIAKEDAYKNYTNIKNWKDNSDNTIASLYKYKESTIFSFDSFDDKGVYAFKEALDYAEELGLKNFIIDLSTNGGGNDTMVSYMMSIMTEDDMVFKTTSVISNSKMKKLIEVDKNLDGVFDEKDKEVKYDFNFAILESKVSFSCGNLLPCLAKDNGIAVVGENSGGGSCAVSLNFTPNNYLYCMSGINKLVMADGQDVDLGATPDLVLKDADEDDCSGLYDFDSINAFLKEFYKANEEPEKIVNEISKEKNQVESTAETNEDTQENEIFITEATEKETQNSKVNNPKTGDNIVIWISLMVTSILGAIGTALYVKREEI